MFFTRKSGRFISPNDEAKTSTSLLSSLATLASALLTLSPRDLWRELPSNPSFSPLPHCRREMSRKEEFTSTTGSTICLGHFKSKTNTARNHSQVIEHDSVMNTSVQARFSGGLTEAKFGKGFTRRQQSQIQNPLADAEVRRIENYQAAKRDRNEAAAAQRIREMERRNYSAGYNIISGQVVDSQRAASVTKAEGVKCFTSYLGDEAPARGKATLRESQGRYFAPFPSGHNQEYRQKVLYNEGLQTNRYTGILEPHKPDLPSHGIEDQFSKSQYTRTSIWTQTGLCETREPGRFTPRKIPDHPSGNDNIVRSWNTNIDINNRTLQGKE